MGAKGRTADVIQSAIPIPFAHCCEFAACAKWRGYCLQKLSRPPSSRRDGVEMEASGRRRKIAALTGLYLPIWARPLDNGIEIRDMSWRANPAAQKRRLTASQNANSTEGEAT